MTRYLVDITAPENELLLSAHGVEAASPERAMRDAIATAVGLCPPSAPPAIDSWQVALFTQDQSTPERWVDLAEPARFKLLVPGQPHCHTAAVCFHSDWPLSDAILTCEQCLASSFPGNVNSLGGSYHKPGCKQGRRGIAACTLHIGPRLVRGLLAWGAEAGEEYGWMKAGNLTVAALRQLFGDALPTMTPQDETGPGSTQLHTAVLGALWESRTSKIRAVAQVRFPAGDVREGSIWKVRGGGYAALVDGVFWLLEYPAEDDARADAAAIERWEITKSRGGKPMLLPLI